MRKYVIIDYSYINIFGKHALNRQQSGQWRGECWQLYVAQRAYRIAYSSALPFLKKI